MDEVKLKLSEIIKTIDDLYLNTPIISANVEAELKDLGIDSLGRINLFYGIIDFYGVELDESIASNWKTLNDILKFVESL